MVAFKKQFLIQCEDIRHRGHHTIDTSMALEVSVPRRPNTHPASLQSRNHNIRNTMASALSPMSTTTASKPFEVRMLSIRGVVRARVLAIVVVPVKVAKRRRYSYTVSNASRIFLRLRFYPDSPVNCECRRAHTIRFP
jgi:hypothetical protein